MDPVTELVTADVGLLFRSMIEDIDGLPKLGSKSARYLGVRYPADVEAFDAHGLVGPGGGGVSVSPDDPMNLPEHRRPEAMGGTGPDPVWMIRRADLGPLLNVAQTSRQHALLEPARKMTTSEFDAAVAATRGKWKRYGDRK
jgi:hypothetical protein